MLIGRKFELMGYTAFWGKNYSMVRGMRSLAITIAGFSGLTQIFIEKARNRFNKKNSAENPVRKDDG